MGRSVNSVPLLFPGPCGPWRDVPIQHVDSGVLKSMRRGYGERQVRDLVERFRARVPGGTFRTTFIAGHPGETDEAFQKLCDFVREAEMDHVGVLNFSREEGTVGALLPKRVPQKEVDARRHELLRIQREVSKLRAMRGKRVRVLVEGPSDESEYLLMGRHEGQARRSTAKSTCRWPRRRRARHALRRIRSRRRAHRLSPGRAVSSR